MKGYKRLTHKDDIYYVDVINDKHGIVCSPKSDNNLCVVLSAQKIVKLLNQLVELENAIESGELCEREEVRKETAKEILKPLYDCIMEHPDCCVNLSEDIKFPMKKIRH